MDEIPPKQPIPLDYVAVPERPPHWISRGITRLSKPMPMGVYYLITTILGMIALAIMLIAKFIISMFH